MLAALLFCAVFARADLLDELPIVVIDTPSPGSARYFGSVNVRFRVLNIGEKTISTVLKITGNAAFTENFDVQENVTVSRNDIRLPYGRYDVLARVVGVPAFARVTFFMEPQVSPDWMPVLTDKSDKPQHSEQFSSLFESLLPKYEPMIDFGCMDRYYISHFNQGVSPLYRVKLARDDECSVADSIAPPFALARRNASLREDVLGSTVSFCLQAYCSRDLDSDGVRARLSNVFSVTSRRSLLIWPENHLNPALSSENFKSHITDLGMHIHEVATEHFRRQSPESYLAPWSYVLDAGPPANPDQIHYTGPDLVIVTSDEEGPLNAPVFTLEISLMNLHAVASRVYVYFASELVATSAEISGPFEELELSFPNLNAEPFWVGGKLSIRAELVYLTRRVRASATLGFKSAPTDDVTAVTSGSPPPTDPPENFIDDFSMGGLAGMGKMYRDDTRAAISVWPAHTIDSYISQIISRQILKSNYRYTDRNIIEALDYYSGHVMNKTVLVVGSATPWYESFVVAYGGRTVSVDYNPTVYDHKLMTTMTLTELGASRQKFDTIFCISNVEHDGLGRYGDAVDPNGDLRAMNELRQFLNPDGVVFWAIPIGRDAVQFNAHRVYGRNRLELILRGWDVLATYGLERSMFDNTGEPIQPLFVLRMSSHNGMEARTERKEIFRGSSY